MNYFSFFKSINNTDYKVDIITDPGSEYTKEFALSGEQPAVISYEAPENLFEPLRTSVATVKLLADHYPMDIYTGKADGTEILIYRFPKGEVSWECIWRGYLQPNIYNQGYSNDIEPLELVASDYISTLQYFDYHTDKKKIVSFKSILEKICNLFTGLAGFAVSDIANREDGKKIYLEDLYVSEANFFSTEDEPWKMQEVLKEICQFLGLTAIMKKDIMFLLDYSDISANQLYRIYYKNKNYVPESFTAGKNANITKDSYMLTGADMSLDDVYNKISVRDGEYNIKNLLPDINDAERMRNYNGAWEATQKRKCVVKQSSSGPVSVGNAYYRFFEHKDWDSLWYNPSFPQNATPMPVPVEDRKRGDAGFFMDYMMSSIMDYYFIGGRGVADKVDFKRYILLGQNNRPTYTSREGKVTREKLVYPLLETRKIAPVIYGDNAWLILNFSLAKTFFVNQPFMVDDNSVSNALKPSGMMMFEYYSYLISEAELTPVLNFFLSINGKWFNGKEWQDSKTSFQVKCSELEIENYFNTETKSLNNITGDLFVGELGYKIKMPAGSAADNIYFAIANPEPLLCMVNESTSEYGKGGNAYTWIGDISMKIVREGQQLWSDDDVVYENVISEENVMDGPSITLKLTSDNEKSFSYCTVGIMENGNIIPLRKMKKSRLPIPQRPEENIIETYVNQYSTPSVKENVTLNMDFDLFDTITDTYWKKDFVVAGTEMDLSYDRQTLSLVQKK